MSPILLEIEWQGPFEWPERGARDHPLSKIAGGVYLFTVEYADGYLIYAAGITSRRISTRLREHTRAYERGIYNVLDIHALRHARRVKIWQGFWTKERPKERQDEFERRREAIVSAAREQMRGFRIFVAEVPNEARLRNRAEAAIMRHLYAQAHPFDEIPDRGMYLAPRRSEERIVRLLSRCSKRLHCLPTELEI